MPKYKVKAPDGRTVTLSGDKPPTDADLDEIFSTIPEVKKSSIPSKQINLNDRIKTATAYGLIPAMAGEKKEDISRSLNQLAPDIYQVAGNIVGGATAPMMGIPPQAGAAYGGSLARGGYEGYRQLINREKLDPQKILKQTQAGAIGEATGLATFKGLEKFGPYAEKKAINLMEKVFKPTGKLAKKSVDISKTALSEGLVGTKQGMLEKVYEKLRKGTETVDSIIKDYSSRTISPEKALSNLDALEKEYVKAADRSSADYVRKLKEAMIEDQKLNQPVYGEVEKGAFQMGGGTLTKPKKVVLQKNEPTGFINYRQGKLTKPKIISEETRIFGDLGEELKPKRTNRIIDQHIYDSKPHVESRTAKTVRDPRIIDEKIYEGKTRGLQGPPRKVREVVGEEPRPVSLEEAQELKRGQYRLLESKRAEGGYGQEVLSPEIRSRQAVARGWKSGIEDAIPEENIPGLNKRLGNLVDVSTALEKRIPIADRQNVIGLGDMIFGGASFYDPKALGVLLGRKILGTDTVRSGIAQSLFKASKERGVGAVVNSPLARAYIARLNSRENG